MLNLCFGKKTKTFLSPRGCPCSRGDGTESTWRAAARRSPPSGKTPPSRRRCQYARKDDILLPIIPTSITHSYCLI